MSRKKAILYRLEGVCAVLALAGGVFLLLIATGAVFPPKHVHRGDMAAAAVVGVLAVVAFVGGFVALLARPAKDDA